MHILVMVYIEVRAFRNWFTSLPHENLDRQALWQIQSVLLLEGTSVYWEVKRLKEWVRTHLDLLVRVLQRHLLPIVLFINQ